MANEKNVEYFVPGVNLSETYLTKEEMGNAGWKVLHSVSTIFIHNVKLLKNFFYAFANQYPCRICREHFVKMISEFPPVFTSRKKFSLYVVRCHNRVNQRLGKNTYAEKNIENFLNRKYCCAECLQQNIRIRHENLSPAQRRYLASAKEKIEKYNGGDHLCSVFLTREQLGKASWLLMHSMASMFPDAPSEEQKYWSYTFITSFAQLYPCLNSKKTFLNYIYKKDNPFGYHVLRSGYTYRKWLCEFHNHVNFIVKKPLYDFERIDENFLTVQKVYTCVDEMD